MENMEKFPVVFLLLFKLFFFGAKWFTILQKSVILFFVTPNFPYATQNLCFTNYYVLVEVIKAACLSYNATS